jgi:hypothetical protein
MKIAAVLASMVLSGCAHHAAQVAWSRIELGHGSCGARAEVELVLDHACAATVTANGTQARRAPLDAADCQAVLAMAAHRAAHAPPACTAPQPFIAGVAITLDDGRMAYACWDDPLASRMAALADELAPDWRRGYAAQGSCDFRGDPIEGDVVAPTPTR